MALDPTPGPQPDPRHVGGDDPLGEQELDQLLADASALASEVTAEIGVDPSAARGVTSRHTVAEHAPDVDNQLKELDGLVQTAAHELGGDVQDATGVSASFVKTASAEVAAPPVPIPDFMEEFTQGTVPAEAEKSRRADATTAAPAAGEREIPSAPAPVLPDFMDEFTRPEPAPATATLRPNAVPEPKGEIPAGPRRLMASTSPPKSVADEFELEPDASADFSVGDVDARAMHAAEKRTSIPLKACEKGLAVLELIDRPIQRLGVRARRVIGWVAITALIAAGSLVIAAGMVL